MPTGMRSSGMALPGFTSTVSRGDDLVAGRKALRREDVGELAVLVVDQRDEGGAVRIVFEPLDGRRHVELGALEVDHAVGALVPAAAMERGDAAGVVAPAASWSRPSVSALTGLPFQSSERST